MRQLRARRGPSVRDPRPHNHSWQPLALEELVSTTVDE
jgi:hypothetical protein